MTAVNAWNLCSALRSKTFLTCSLFACIRCILRARENNFIITDRTVADDCLVAILTVRCDDGEFVSAPSAMLFSKVCHALILSKDQKSDGGHQRVLELIFVVDVQLQKVRA